MSEDVKTTVFKILLLLAAPVLIPLIMLFPPDLMRERQRERADGIRADVVAACDAGDLPRVRELVMRWDHADPGSSLPDEVLVVLSSVSMTDGEKIRYARRRAGERSP